MTSNTKPTEKKIWNKELAKEYLKFQSGSMNNEIWGAAQYKLYIIYKKEGNSDLAMEYLKGSADHGHTESKKILDNIHKEEKDKIIKSLKVSADQGHLDNQLALGLAYKKQGNIELSIKYYLLATEQGDFHAQSALSRIYKDIGKQEIFDCAIDSYDEERSFSEALKVCGENYENNAELDNGIF
jgi:TPR repeat protein